MTVSVSIYDYIMTIFLVYVITSAISYYLKINDIGYYKYGATIISALLYIACICFRYDRVLKWKMNYTGNYYLKPVIIISEILITVILSVINFVGIHLIDNTELTVITYIVTGVCLIVISLAALFLYKNKNDKNVLKITISKEITEQEEKEEHEDDIKCDGGITFILNNGTSRVINFEKENIYLNNRKDLIIYKGDDLTFDGNRGAIMYKATEINGIVLKTITNKEKKFTYTSCF